MSVIIESRELTAELGMVSGGKEATESLSPENSL